MKEKVKRCLRETSFKNILKDFKYYFRHNILFLTFVLLSLINGSLLRFFTVKNGLDFSPIMADFTVIILVGAFSFLLKPRHRFKYYMTCLVIFTGVCVINSAYYSNYVSFTSFSLLATSVQIFGVSEALNNIVEIKDFSYILAPIILLAVRKQYKNTSYYDSMTDKRKSRKAFIKFAVLGLVSLGVFLTTLTSVDISRLNKQWNREYVVMKFGIYVYQGNDFIASLRPQISPLFGYDKAARNVREYYDEFPFESFTNKYTDKYKGKNIIVIHAESIQNFLIDRTINDLEITPNLNRLAKEGLYFSNFYSQESVGTSSDSEFTFNTSLLPASNGTVFVSYWDREYISIPKLLKEQNYYTFSMHANKGNFWNRENMHQKLGYDKFYNYTGSYKINNDQVIGLGLNDKEFFKQSTDIMTKIDNKHENWYGVLLMLTNHTPFKGITDSDLDLTYKHTITNEDGESEEVINNYLTDTILGNYFVSSHYSDAAIGEFIEHLDEAGLLDNTIVIIYGDHDAKIKRSEFNYYYNYNPETDSRYGTDDPNYKEFTKNDYELNRSVPFIIWTKDNKENKKINTVMGMYDVLPTLGNMIGIRSPYALGHDIFSINENFVIFPNGNWITNKMYYNSQNDEGILLDENAVITADYISKITERAERAITASNDIIVHDLIRKMRESNAITKGD